MSLPPRPIAPLDAAAIRAALGVGVPFQVRSIGVTGSTNSDLAAGYLTGQYVPGQVLIAQQQTTGKGRLGRTWHAPYGSSQILSVLVLPAGVPMARRGWIGGLLGLALVEAIAGSGARAELKWPNDVLIDSRKCAGILAEVAGDAVVVGAGLNLDLTDSDYPERPAGSTALLPTSLRNRLPPGADLDRVALAASTLRNFAALLQQWVAAQGDMAEAGLLELYRGSCGTIGQSVRVELPDGTAVIGTAQDVTPDGALLVRTVETDRPAVLRTFTAGDVVHLRPGHLPRLTGDGHPPSVRDVLGPG